MIQADNETRDLLRKEITRLANAKFHLYDYVRETIMRNPGWVDGKHIHTICDTVEAFLGQSEKKGLMISMPPRHMKSTIISECLPAWYLSNHPQEEVIIASYNQTQARKMSRSCRMMFENDTHRRIFGEQSFDVDSVDEFMLSGKQNHRPSLLARGIGSSVTGSGASLFILDDPVASFQDADSQVMRDKTYEWYQSVALTRLSPAGHIILVMTRWHYDDVCGRILNDDAENWDVLNLPAINDDGMPLWEERFPLPVLTKMRESMGERTFNALYQGRPLPTTGGIFKREHIRYGDVFPPEANRVRYWDNASTHGGGDWTVGCLMAEYQGQYCIEDIQRIQGSPAEKQDLIRTTAQRDGINVKIRMEQEPGSSGVEIIDLYSRRILAGFNFKADKVTGSKTIRAEPLASAMECGNVFIVRSPWNRALVDEMCEFPLGSHDDQVDACSGAYHSLTHRLTSTNVWMW